MTISRTAVGAATGLLVLTLTTLAAGQPAGCSTPVSERQGEIGCYTTAETPLGVLPPGPLFWHLYAYPSRPSAESARGPIGTVTESPPESTGSIPSRLRAFIPAPASESPSSVRS